MYSCSPRKFFVTRRKRNRIYADVINAPNTICSSCECISDRISLIARSCSSFWFLFLVRTTYRCEETVSYMIGGCFASTRSTSIRIVDSRVFEEFYAISSAQHQSGLSDCRAICSFKELYSNLSPLCIHYICRLLHFI